MQRGLRRGAAPAARAAGGQGGDRRAALARRARRGGRRGRRSRAVAAHAEAAGYKTHWGRKVLEIRPPVRIDKGAGIVALLRDTRPRRRDLRRRRHDRPRRVPRPHELSRWAASAPPCASACARTRARRSSSEEADVMVDGHRRRARAAEGAADLTLRFVDFLKATVLLSAGFATLLAAYVLGMRARLDATLIEVASAGGRCRADRRLARPRATRPRRRSRGSSPTRGCRRRCPSCGRA